MTLVLTELSKVGIAMAADSAITRFDQRTGYRHVNAENWIKLLRVPSIKAAVSYWGFIGAVPGRERFDTWLQRFIDTRNYCDLPTFAEKLAQALNAKCNSRPLRAGQYMGIHVAGYHEWGDNHRRPTIFHVHNGHGSTRLEIKIITVDGKKKIVSLCPKWEGEVVRLFAKHQDFPNVKKTTRENIEYLKTGVLIRNGDYVLYSLVSESLEKIFAHLNLIPNVTIPRNPNELGSRKGYLHMMVEIMAKIYGCSSIGQTIGGKVSSLGIHHNETYCR